MASELRIRSKARCVAPTLSQVQFSEIGGVKYVRYTWDNAGVNYGNGSAVLELSYDGGTTFNAIALVPADSSPETVTHAIFANISNGQQVQFRVTISGGYCNNMQSNVINTRWLFIDPIEPTEPELELFLRSSAVEYSSNPTFNYCGLNTAYNSILIDRQGRSGYDVQFGDKLYINPTTPFNGNLKVYMLYSPVQPTLEQISYIARVDNSGFVFQVIGQCITTI